MSTGSKEKKTADVDQQHSPVNTPRPLTTARARTHACTARPAVQSIAPTQGRLGISHLPASVTPKPKLGQEVDRRSGHEVNDKNAFNRRQNQRSTVVHCGNMATTFITVSLSET